MKKLLLLALLLPLVATSQIISADSATVNFATVMVGSTDSALVTLRNNEGSPLNVTNIKFYSIYGEMPFSASQSTFTIPSNGAQSVWIYFSPTQNIQHNSTMVVQHNATSGHEAVPLSGQGRFPLAYYNSTENLSEQALKVALKARTGVGYTTLSYNVARDNMYGTIDNVGGIVECVYTGRTATFNSRSGANSNNFNCEHTFPQGKFNSASPMKSDIHHLFSTDVAANSARGSNPFGVVANPAHFNVGGSRSDNVNFEPRNIQKGATARAMMYFVIRYQDYQNHFGPQQNILKTWHNAYPVSAIESARNIAIELVQGNRNPFVDYPQLEKRITNFVANSVAPSQFGIDVVQSSINFGQFLAQTNDTFNFVLVNSGNQTINFSNFVLSNTSILSFGAGSGTNSNLAPGDAIKISIIANTPSTNAINETLTFSTNGSFPFGSFSVPITGQPIVVGLTEDNGLNSQLKLFPNPIQDELHIRTEQNEQLHIRLVDVAGKEIDVTFLRGNNGYILPTKEIAGGLYFLQINNGKEQIVRKIIKE